jgi:hypothetical protein
MKIQFGVVEKKLYYPDCFFYLWAVRAKRAAPKKRQKKKFGNFYYIKYIHIYKKSYDLFNVHK